MTPTFYEFFAGGGMARAGLGPQWKCLFANDFDAKKAKVYHDNWGLELKVGDVARLGVNELPGRADLAWASFPCQDLSLAGAGAGLKGERSGTFWPFWNLMSSLRAEARNPGVVVLENVCGALTSHQGRDFTKICEAFRSNDYVVGAMVIDASLFIPHSRPRLFVVGVQRQPGVELDSLCTNEADPLWHSAALVKAHSQLSPELKKSWVWWKLPRPLAHKITLADLLDQSDDLPWYPDQDTEALLAMMTPLNLAKVKSAQKGGKLAVGTIYKRTRIDEYGLKKQRAEVRFDGISGCLRTPSGGSSRQVILVVKGDSVRARLISGRETARLMGLPESYKLPQNYNETYHLTGDGVVVPVVRFLGENLLKPLIEKDF